MRKKSAVDLAMFTRLYMESHTMGHTVAELASRLGITTHRCYQRIHYLKKKGLVLPRLQRSQHAKRRFDVASLQAIVDSHLNQAALIA